MKELAIKILVGIPASGKSTWSKQFLRNNPNWTRVNRDLFREMFRNEQVCDPKIEKLISEISIQAIRSSLKRNLNVLVDNTNLKAEYIEAICEEFKYEATIEIQLFDISLDKAIERDNAREKKVGEQVIRKMWKDYRSLVDGNGRIFENRSKLTEIHKNPVFDPNLDEVILCDLDGTLAHMNGKRGPFDWLRTDVDDLDEIVARSIKDHMALGHKIIFMSGRSEEGRVPTEQWLEFYGFKYHALFMRKANDFRKDNIVKEELYNEHIKGKFNVRHVYDDRQQVVDMWRGLGLKVYQVAKGDF